MFFIHGSVNDSSNLRKFVDKCRYSLFSENQKVFMALRKNFCKINWILVFCLQLLFFWQSDF